MALCRRTFIVSAASVAAVPRTLVAARAKTGTVTGHVSIRKRRQLLDDRSDVIVWVAGVGQLPDTSNRHHEIRQINREFVPRVSAVMVGTTLSFPNDDNIYHNVYSASEALRFDLGHYRGGQTETRKTERPGLVEVYCNIHHEMRAFVLVLDTSHFVQTGSDGAFTLPRVPVGAHTLSVWHPDSEPRQEDITVRPDRTTDIDLTLTARPFRRRHTRKNHTAHTY
jgi:plastocyanin